MIRCSSPASTSLATRSVFDHIHLDDIVTSGCTSAGFRVQGVSENLVFTNVDGSNIGADNISGTGIQFNTSADVTGLKILNSTFSNNLLGISTSGTGGTNDVRDVLMQNVTFDNCGGRAMYLEKLNNAVLDQLTITNCALDAVEGKHGISFNLKNGNHKNITVSNSTITNTGGGSYTDYGFGILIRSNLDEGATLDYVRIYDNTITGNPVTAIGIEGDGGTDAGPTNVIIRGNNLSGNIGTVADSAAGGLYVQAPAFFGNTIDARGNYWGTGTVDCLLLDPLNPSVPTASTLNDPEFGESLPADLVTFQPAIVSFNVPPNEYVKFIPLLDSAAGRPSIEVDPAYAGSSVGDPVGGGTYGEDRFDKIDDAIAGVAKGGTVSLAATTFTETIFADRPVTINGDAATSTTIVPPATDTTNFTDYYAAVVNPPVRESATPGITLDNLSVVDNPSAPLRDTSGMTIRPGAHRTLADGNSCGSGPDVTVSDADFDGSAGGVEIGGGASAVSVTGGNFQNLLGKNAIKVSTAFTKSPAAIQNITIGANTIQNSDGVPIVVEDAQHAADGSISVVTIANNSITSNNYTASVAIDSLLTGGNQAGAIVFSNGVTDASVRSNTIDGNTNLYGGILNGAADANGFDVLIRKNTISNNTGFDLFTGGVFDTGETASALRIRNVTDASAAKAEFNLISGNDAGASNTSSDEFHACLNWWGAADGPGGVATGAGDAITADVRYLPFLTVNTYDPDVDFSGDADVDSLSDNLEAAIGSNANVRDTDGDGFEDGVEVALCADILTDQGALDSDGDGLPDSADPGAGDDFDGDRYLDFYEVITGSDPSSADSSPSLGDVVDSDGLNAADGLAMFQIGRASCRERVSFTV